MEIFFPQTPSLYGDASEVKLSRARKKFRLWRPGENFDALRDSKFLSHAGPVGSGGFDFRALPRFPNGVIEKRRTERSSR